MLKCWWYSKQKLHCDSVQAYNWIADICFAVHYPGLNLSLLPLQLCLWKHFPHTFPWVVEIKRQENPAKHCSLVLCQEAIPRQKKPRTLEVLILIFLLPAITNPVAFTTASHSWGLGREECGENIIFVLHILLCNLSLFIVVLLEGEQKTHGSQVAQRLWRFSLALATVRQPQWGDSTFPHQLGVTATMKALITTGQNMPKWLFYHLPVLCTTSHLLRLFVSIYHCSAFAQVCLVDLQFYFIFVGLCFISEASASLPICFTV